MAESNSCTNGAASSATRGLAWRAMPSSVALSEAIHDQLMRLDRGDGRALRRDRGHGVDGDRTERARPHGGGRDTDDPRPPRHYAVRVALSAEPFTIAVPDAVLDDLRTRIRATRWPDASPADAWEQGVDLAYLRGLVAYWADGFDWRAQERALNRFAHFHAAVDGVRIHYVYERARSGPGLPLVLTHGWPSTFT